MGTQAKTRRKESNAEETAVNSPAMPSVGPALAVMTATALGAGALFAYLLSHHKAGAGWLVFFAGAVALYLESHHLPGMRERFLWRRSRREAGRLARSVRRALKKQGPGLGPKVSEQFEVALSRVDEARLNGDLRAIDTAAVNLDELADKHLARKSVGREYVEQIGGAIVVALLLRAFFYEPFKIPSASMVPTLLVGDHLFVNKFVYGLRLPFTTLKFGTQVPERGEIVVFIRPGGGDDIIKRVVGLPGEVVEVRNRRITVNGKAFETRPLGTVRLNAAGDSAEVTEEGPFSRYQAFSETIGDEAHIALADLSSGPRGSPRAEGRWEVKPGHIFVMGDNRDNSADSRMDFGPEAFGQVPIENIIGRADVIWFSKGGPYGVRFDRLFTRIR